MNRVAVLGSTGSIGTRTLEIARRLSDRIQVVALAGGRDGRMLGSQIEEFRPSLYHTLAGDLEAPDWCRSSSLEAIAADQCVDTVVVATPGRPALTATLSAIEHGKRVALATKEVLVMAGHLVMEALSRHGATLIPVDSEHSAIWQCLRGENSAIRRLLLTASGGPFYSYSMDELHWVTAEQALAHPVWSMGAKITIDSATLMNKGLEVIEAGWLFGVTDAYIDVVVHPECVVHSMVEFVDGSTKAQLGAPDMALPIQYAITYPERIPGLASPLTWEGLRVLTFKPVDAVRFRCLSLAREAGAAGRSYPAVLCGADDAAVALFLKGEAGFVSIATLVDGALNAHQPYEVGSVADAFNAYDFGYQWVMSATGCARAQ